jgi:hypothetical protein
MALNSYIVFVFYNTVNDFAL